MATATLTEGVNLPFDLIFLTSLKRTSWDPAAQQRIVAPMPMAEFRNLAGRAGRTGAARGIEGMTLVALPTEVSTTAAGTRPTQQRQMAEWIIRRCVGIVDHLYPDPDERRRLYQYGLPPVIGQRFEPVAEQMRQTLADTEGYGPWVQKHASRSSIVSAN